MMKTLIKILIIVLMIVLAYFCCAYTVNQNEIAVVARFGKVVNVIDEPGLNTRIPIIESISYISKKLQHYDMKPSGVITKDKKSMICDNFVVWKIVDPIKYIRTLNSSYSGAIDRIESSVFNAVKSSISSMTQEDVIASRGDTLTKIITDLSNKNVVDYGIYIVQVEIKKLDLPDDNKNAVYNRMISERQNIAASYSAQGKSEAQKIRNATDKKVSIMLSEANQKANILIAEGEAEYMKTLQSAYDTKEKADFYTYIRGLDSLKNSLKGSNKTIILDKDSELVKLLYN